MFVTNCGTRAYLFRISQQLGCDICTFRPVAKIFCNLLFVAVCSHDTVLNRYLRNKRALRVAILANEIRPAQVTLGQSAFGLEVTSGRCNRVGARRALVEVLARSWATQKLTALLYMVVAYCIAMSPARPHVVDEITITLKIPGYAQLRPQLQIHPSPLRAPIAPIINRPSSLLSCDELI